MDFLRDTGYPFTRLVVITLRQDRGKAAVSWQDSAGEAAMPTLADWQGRDTLFAAVGAWRSSQALRLTLPRGAVGLRTAQVTAGFFDVPPGWASASPIVTFVGPSTYDTNLRAARAFLQHVWPKVTSRVSSAEFRLVGLGWEAFRGTPGVVDRGWVDERYRARYRTAAGNGRRVHRGRLNGQRVHDNRSRR